jgi:hypothetical protein
VPPEEALQETRTRSSRRPNCFSGESHVYRWPDGPGTMGRPENGPKKHGPPRK